MAIKSLSKLMRTLCTVEQGRIEYMVAGISFCAVPMAFAPTVAQISAYMGYSTPYAQRVYDRYKNCAVNKGGKAISGLNFMYNASVASIDEEWSQWPSNVQGVIDGIKNVNGVVEGSFEDAYLFQYTGLVRVVPPGVITVCREDEGITRVYDASKLRLRVNSKAICNGAITSISGGYTIFRFYGANFVYVGEDGVAFRNALRTFYNDQTMTFLLGGLPMTPGYFGCPPDVALFSSVDGWHASLPTASWKAGVLQLLTDHSVAASALPSEFTGADLSKPLCASFLHTDVPAAKDAFEDWAEVKGESEFEELKIFEASGDLRTVNTIRKTIAALPARRTFGRFNLAPSGGVTIAATLGAGVLTWTLDATSLDRSNINDLTGRLGAALALGAAFASQAVIEAVNASAWTLGQKEAALDEIAGVLKPVKYPVRIASGRAYDSAYPGASWLWTFGPISGLECSKMALCGLIGTFGFIDESVVV